ncbi:DUF5682 family protein [Saccharopolyspora shandongensis]|uniref:DUF5682 family protein n=1 Tax=Saccharopolyspora shandongensis TaxID=418495 RepID=UPI0034373143
MDAFDGYQSGMPSPEYYQQVWETDGGRAARTLLESAISRLRQRNQHVPTASLISTRAMTDGLARLRGHRNPARADVLDGLAGALVGEAIDRPLPWTGRGRLETGTHPVIAELVAAFRGDRATERVQPQR